MGRLTEIAPGVFVATSSYALTTSTVVAGSAGGCLVIDPAVTVSDLAELAASLGDLGLRPAVAWSTHPHWDHVLWSRSLGDAPRYAAPAAVSITETERDAIVDGVEKSAPGHDLSLVGQLTPLDAVAIPWGGPEAQLIVHDGHAPGHGAVFLPDTGVLVAGDMCSDVEIPLLDTVAADPLGDYRTGMERLASVVGVRQVVPGHGHVGDAGEFRRRLALDALYLDAITAGSRPPTRGLRMARNGCGSQTTSRCVTCGASVGVNGLGTCYLLVRQKRNSIIPNGLRCYGPQSVAAAPRGVPR